MRLMSAVGSMSKFGVAVVGLGIAGKVRVRDLLDPKFNTEGKWKLHGIVSRRVLEEPPANVLTEDEILNSNEIKAIIVCTEPAEHEYMIRKSLDQGKHVLVEYPVVPSATVTREFFYLAEKKGLILHEENIALLTPGFQSLKQQLSDSKNTVVKGEISLLGNYNGWSEDFEGSGGPFCTNISMIQTLYELFGDDITAIGGQLDRDDESFTAIAKLTCAKCKDLTLHLRRTKQKTARKKTTIFHLKDGSTITENSDLIAKRATDNSNDQRVPGLFMQDFLLFVDKLEDKTGNTADKKRVLHCIQIAEDIHKYMGLKGSL